MVPIFKNASGVWFTKQLFYEYASTDRTFVLYTLKTEDHEGTAIIDNEEVQRVYPSLRRLYMELGDESEFLFAEKYFGGYPHWKKLLACSWFMDHLTEIREELAARNAALALSNIKQMNSFQANKYLLEQGWIKDQVGRPSKEKIKREAEKLAKDMDLSDDFERISEHIIGGATFQ